MTRLLEFCVGHPADTVRARVRSVLVSRGYAVRLDSRGNGVAERGNSWREAPGAPKLPPVRLDIRLSSDPHTTVIQLERGARRGFGRLFGGLGDEREVQALHYQLADALGAPCLVGNFVPNLV